MLVDYVCPYVNPLIMHLHPMLPVVVRVRPVRPRDEEVAEDWDPRGLGIGGERSGPDVPPECVAHHKAPPGEGGPHHVVALSRFGRGQYSPDTCFVVGRDNTVECVVCPPCRVCPPQALLRNPQVQGGRSAGIEHYSGGALAVCQRSDLPDPQLVARVWFP